MHDKKTVESSPISVYIRVTVDAARCRIRASGSCLKTHEFDTRQYGVFRALARHHPVFNAD